MAQQYRPFFIERLKYTRHVKSSQYQGLLDRRDQGRKQLAVLIDPDRLKLQFFDQVLQQLDADLVDLLFVGGSLLADDQLDFCLHRLREHCDLPLILFPGSPLQISAHADAMLLLSLISGRNPELLIGHHVLAAPYIRAAGLEAIPTGYLLVDGGRPTTASYISNTLPLPADKPEIAACTAMAGELLGLRLLYLDAGSGALQPVDPTMIAAVRAAVALPLVVGGGLRSPEKVTQALRAGADVVVVGTIMEQDPGRLREIGAAVRHFEVAT